MPRTLPWLVEAAKKKESRHVSSSSPAPRGGRASSPRDLVDSDLNAIGDISPEPKPKKQLNRTPSTSPPPAPPDVEFMREGYNADDIHMMVEDEFLSTAKMFTQHIHHAEYVRLKKLAKSRGTGTLQAISRSTDGRTEQSNALRMRLEAEETAKKIKNGVTNVSGEDESSGSEDEYMHDPQLAGLMTNKSQVRKDLSGVSKARSNTRAAAGFSQSPQNIERKRDVFADNGQAKTVAPSTKAAKVLDDQVSSDASEDDLDAAPSRPIRPAYAKALKRQHATDGNLEQQSFVKNRTMERVGVFERFANPVEERQDNVFKSRPKQAEPTAKEDAKRQSPTKHQPMNKHAQSSAASEHLAKRRAEKERKEREEKRKAKKADEIPTFLF